MQKKYKLYLLALIPIAIIITLVLMPQSKRKDDEIIYVDANPYECTITVNVEGEVLKKGSYVMYKDQTIKDLLEKCGTTDYTNLSNSKLQEHLQDGATYILEYKDGKNISIEVKSANLTILPSQTAKSDKININTASKDKLCELDMIGPEKAQAIIDYRSEHLFKSIEELKNVTGISDKIYDANKDKITV